MRPGHWFQPGAIDGKAVGATNFFNTVGDALAYELNEDAEIDDAVLLLRYHRWNDEICRIKLKGFGIEEELDMICDGTPMTQIEIPVGKLESGKHSFGVELVEGEQLLIEGFAILPKSFVEDFKVNPTIQDDWPTIVSEGNEIRLSYTDCQRQYSIEALSGTPMDVRRVTGDDVPTAYSIHCNDIAHKHFIEAGDRETAILTHRALPLAARETKTLRFKVGLAGEAIEEVEPFEGVFKVAG